MQPKFEAFNERRVLGVGGKFISVLSPERNNHIVIPKLWDEFINRKQEVKDQQGDYTIGLIAAIIPPEVKSHPFELFYMACVEVQDVNNIIPAGNYAVFTHRGPIARIGETMKYIYQTWLPQSGKKLRKAAELEFYDKRFNPISETSEMEVCIPIE
jgi:AraC family transcriptional regulator